MCVCLAAYLASWALLVCAAQPVEEPCLHRHTPESSAASCPNQQHVSALHLFINFQPLLGFGSQMQNTAPLYKVGIATHSLPGLPAVARCPSITKKIPPCAPIYFHFLSSCSPALPLSPASLTPELPLTPPHPLTAVCGSCTGDDCGAPAVPALSRLPAGAHTGSTPAHRPTP